MYFWKVKKVSASEYHVIETRYVNEPEFVLAKCTGPVPAGDIVLAMRVSQSIRSSRDSIHNSIVGVKNALSVFKAEVAAAEKVANDSASHNTTKAKISQLLNDVKLDISCGNRVNEKKLCRKLEKLSALC